MSIIYKDVTVTKMILHICPPSLRVTDNIRTPWALGLVQYLFVLFLLMNIMYLDKDIFKQVISELLVKS